MTDSGVALASVIVGGLFLIFRKQIARSFVRRDFVFGIRFEPGEPRTAVVVLMGMFMVIGGACVLWRQLHG